MALVAGAVGLWAVDRVVGVLPSFSSWRVNAVVGFTLCLAVAGFLVWRVVLLPCSWKMLGIMLVFAGIMAFGLSWPGFQAAAAPFKIVFGSLGGLLIGRQFVNARWLLIAAVVALGVDVWSVFAGPTRVVVEHAPRTLDFLLVKFPSLGDPEMGFGLGISDFLFLALFVAGSRLSGLRPKAGLYGMLVAVVATVVGACMLEEALPALPLLCAAFIAVNLDLFIRGSADKSRL